MARTHTPHFLRGRHRKTVPASTATAPTATAAPPVPTTPAPLEVPVDTRATQATPVTTRQATQQATPATRTTPEAFHYDDRARLASYRRTAPRPPAGQAGAWLVLVVTLTVMYAEWALFPQDARGQSDANWALVFTIISMAGALRILVGNPGRHLVSVAAILVSGVGFLLRAFLVTGVPTWVLVYEGGCGALLLLGGLMVLRSPVLEPDPPATDPWG